MYEFTIFDKRTNEEDILFGYSWMMAVKACGLEQEVKDGTVILLRKDYAD